jgi:hypothetical protein
MRLESRIRLDLLQAGRGQHRLTAAALGLQRLQVLSHGGAVRLF